MTTETAPAGTLAEVTKRDLGPPEAIITAIHARTKRPLRIEFRGHKNHILRARTRTGSFYVKGSKLESASHRAVRKHRELANSLRWDNLTIHFV